MSVLTDVTEGVRARVAKWAGKATQGPIPMPEGYYPAAIPFYTGFSPDDWNSTLGRMTPAEMYASQPYLRLVVDYEEAPWRVNHGRIPLTDVARKAMTSVFKPAAGAARANKMFIGP